MPEIDLSVSQPSPDRAALHRNGCSPPPPALHLFLAVTFIALMLPLWGPPYARLEEDNEHGIVNGQPLPPKPPRPPAATKLAFKGKVVLITGAPILFIAWLAWVPFDLLAQLVLSLRMYGMSWFLRSGGFYCFLLRWFFLYFIFDVHCSILWMLNRSN